VVETNSDNPGRSVERAIIEKVLNQRAEKAISEIKRLHPDVKLEIEIKNDRGILTACEDRFVISKEFVETEDSIQSPRRFYEYYCVLKGKSRLVLTVPKGNAIQTFLRMLEFNQIWLFYYQIYFYDDEGHIKRMDRKTWCEMTGRPYDPPYCPPEIA
jgi:hypothetical protein